MHENGERSVPESVLQVLLMQLSYMHPVSDLLRKAVSDKAFIIKLAGNEHLVREGDFCFNIYFVVKGALIGYTSRRKRNITTFISLENEFLTSISGMYGQSPSKESIKAVISSELVAIPGSSLVEWFDLYPETNVIIRKLWESYYQQAQERSIIIRLGTAKEKFLYYLFAYPGNIDRIPLNVIAHFLDIKPETLIKIKKQYELNIDDTDIRHQAESIHIFIKSNQLYKRKRLTIAKLAAELNIPPYRLSYIINHYYKVNYIWFINAYRVEYVKHKLKSPGEWHHLTIDALGSESGFSSRSSFFDAFKKITGLSPASYAQQDLNNL